jgi:hypothetical protein
VADQGIKKATVLKEDLPSFNASNLGYFVRYRIISSDRNRSSHWSPYHFLITGTIQKVDCSVTFIQGQPDLNIINMVWKHPKLFADPENKEISIFKEYDIYIKTNLDDDWVYLASSSSTQFSTIAPEGILSFQVAVQVPVYPKIYSPDAAIFTLEDPLVV